MVWGQSGKTVKLLPLRMGFKCVVCQMKRDILLYLMIDIIRMILIWASYDL